MNDKTYEIVTRNRHLRYVYFIEEGYAGDKLLNLINSNQKTWGGRLNPIISITKIGISPAWKQLVKEYDPDYVGHTGNLAPKSIITLCEQLGFNPIEVINVDDPTFRIKGVHSQYLLPAMDSIFDHKSFIPQCTALWSVQSPLKEYFKLNYLLDDSYQLTKTMLGPHQPATFEGKNIGEFNRILGEQPIFNPVQLSFINSNTTKMRTFAGPHFEWFELVIAKDYNCPDDILYHWNRALYAPRNYPISSFLITAQQLHLLLQDPNFERALYNLPTNEARIEVVSFSLSSDEVKAAKDKLAAFATQLQFHEKYKPVFPYEKSDSNGSYPPDFKEQPLIRTVTGNNPLIDVPSLSFNPTFRSDDSSWCADIDITEIGKHKGYILFPLKTRARQWFHQVARIKKNKTVTCEVYSGGDQHLKLRIPTFLEIISQLITRPCIINEHPQETEPIKYQECKYNDGSRRLKEFINLFGGDFDFISDYIFDKFWADILYDLTDNTKVEGDTITFQQIIERYYKIIASHNFITSRHAASRYNDENLRLGIRDTLQPLLTRRVFLPGYVIKCRSCSSNIWYSLKEADIQMTCKGCGAEISIIAELPFSYKLNHLIKNNIGLRSAEGKFSPDGNYTAIKTIIHLNNKAGYNFQHVPQLDIFDSFHSQKPVTDLDISCMVDGFLYVGECKHNSTLFSADGHKSLKNLLEIAEIIRPDYILIACTVDQNDKLHKAQQYLEYYINKWDVQPKVYAYTTSEPDYDLKSYRYFRY